MSSFTFGTAHSITEQFEEVSSYFIFIHQMFVIFVYPMASIFLLITIVQYIIAFIKQLSLQNIKKHAVNLYLATPPGRIQVQKQIHQSQEELREDFRKKVAKPTAFLPKQKANKQNLIKKLRAWGEFDDKSWMHGGVTGTVYEKSDDHRQIISMVFKMFMPSNPLHFNIFQRTRQMEAEVISMVLNLFHPPPGACGNTTSGGTVSICQTVLAYREWGRANGINYPNIVVPQSAHCAFEKACFYYNVQLRQAKLNTNTYKTDLASMQKLVDRNTVMIMGSAPDFPFGVLDDIESISELALKKKVNCHVDACLGGLVIAFMQNAGYAIGKFDFQLKGVTSITVDTHKYGYGPKGLSLALFRNKELQRYQMYASLNWMGGPYVTPGIAGSRSGALIACTWAVMVYFGKDQYVRKVKDIVAATRHVTQAIKQHFKEDLKIVGASGKICVVTFMSINPELNILILYEQLQKYGWDMSTCQRPSSLHFAVTHANFHHFQTDFIADLTFCLQTAKQRSKLAKGNTMAAIYGLKAKVPDSAKAEEIMKSIVQTFYQVIEPSQDSVGLEETDKTSYEFQQSYKPKDGIQKMYSQGMKSNDN